MSDRRHVPGDHLRQYDTDVDRGAEVDHQSPGERDPGLEPRPARVRWIGLAAGVAEVRGRFSGRLETDSDLEVRVRREMRRVLTRTGWGAAA